LFPIKDNIPSQKKPVINYLIIIINIIIFFYELSLSIPELEKLINTYGFIPNKFKINFKNNKFSFETYKTLVTHMFFHGNLLHIFSNLWFLYIFGDNVEDEIGHIGYIIFYVTTGIGACLIQYIFDTTSNIPMIGASGAISGVLGAYIVFYPRAKVLSLVPIFLLLPIPIPAIIFILLWFFFQVTNALTSLLIKTSNIAWIAHVAGFIIGYKIAKDIKKEREKKEGIHYL